MSFKLTSSLRTNFYNLYLALLHKVSYSSSVFTYIPVLYIVPKTSSLNPIPLYPHLDYLYFINSSFIESNIVWSSIFNIYFLNIWDWISLCYKNNSRVRIIDWKLPCLGKRDGDNMLTSFLFVESPDIMILFISMYWLNYFFTVWI